MKRQTTTAPPSLPLRGIIFQYLNTALTFLFPLILFPYLTRTLSSEGYARIGFYESAAQVIMVIAQFGIPHYGIRELNRLHGARAQSAFITRLAATQILFSITGVVVFASWMWVSKLPVNDRALTINYSLIILLSAFSLDWFFQAKEQFHFIFIRTLITKLILLIGVFVFVHSARDVSIYIAITAAVYLVIAVISLLSVFRQYFDIRYLRGFFFRSILKQLAPFAGLGILSTLYISADTLFLGYFSTPTVLGHYVVANKMSRMIIAVLVSSTIVFFARLSSARKTTDAKQISEMQTNSFNYLIHLAIPASILAFLYAPQLLQVLAGGYVDSIPLVRIFSVMILIVALHDFLVIQVLLTHGYERSVFRLFLAVAIPGIMISYFSIRGFGSAGAAWSMVVIETFVLIGSAWLARKEFVWSKRKLAQCISTLVILPIAYLVHQLLPRYSLPTLVLSFLLIMLLYALTQLFVIRNRFIRGMIGWQ